LRPQNALKEEKMLITKKKKTRREFLKDALRLGICLSTASYLWDIIAPNSSVSATGYKEVQWYKQLDGDRVQCDICPKNCLLENGQTCFCRTRTNFNGRLMTAAWNNPSVIEITKIESAPLYHYAVGSEFLAIGVSGCNLRCAYCQNFKVSQHRPEETRNYNFDSDTAVSAVKKKTLNGILFTFTEPIAYLEYLMEVAEKAKSSGLKVAVATSAYINRDAFKEASKNVDAFAVTLKGFSSDFYHRVCGADITPVLKAMETIRAEGKWLEVVNLVVPTMNDNPLEIKTMSEWIKRNLGNETPLHFTRFYPAYKMKSLKETPITSLENAREIALNAGLKYVYVTNIPGHPGGDTYCPDCHNAVINRKGFDVVKINLRAGRCSFCGKEVVIKT